MVGGHVAPHSASLSFRSEPRPCASMVHNRFSVPAGILRRRIRTRRATEVMAWGEGKTLKDLSRINWTTGVGVFKPAKVPICDSFISLRVLSGLEKPGCSAIKG